MILDSFMFLFVRSYKPGEKCKVSRERDRFYFQVSSIFYKDTGNFA